MGFDQRWWRSLDYIRSQFFFRFICSVCTLGFRQLQLGK
nr:MAG TPA: hypothetical protein [Caudoviricetes sp.]